MEQTDPYRRIAGVYDRFIEPLQSGVRKAAVKLLPPQSEWRVLDVGCGTGAGLVPYLDAGCSVSGIDVSPAMLAQAEQRLGDRAQLQLTKGAALPFGDGTFDLTTTTLVLHEVPSEARTSFLNEIARVTKPDGITQVIDFRFGSLRGWKGPTLRAATAALERFSGHYSGYRSFKAAGGVPGTIARTKLSLDREKIVAGGNMAIYLLRPDGA